MENVIVVIILVAIVLGIVCFLWRARKRGETCIGCPHAKACGGKCGGNCSHMHADHGETRD
ncbi:MAG: FeoB-associated Cys-rich membrane protein [Ruminococcaceae bacterium]|nr:FeoB-associated Cys-rich membrane protein [Oscillospiraceae bacterium]